MRYIGNKRKLLEEIKRIFIEKKIFIENYTLFDAFSGTASVGNYFKDKYKIISNDSLYFSYVVSEAKLNPIDKEFKKLNINPFEYFNKKNTHLKGFVYKNYSPGGSERKYFSKNNAMKIDFIRTKIEKRYKKGKINKSEYYYLIACLLESIGKVSNVAGVYGSFLKTRDSRALKDMKFIDLEDFSNNSILKNEVHNDFIETLIDDVKGDILYLDPPYTKNQYSTQYHILETIALYDNPQIFGKTGHREVTGKNSKFSKDGAVHVEFEKLIKKANFKYIILSYNSVGIMSKEFIERVLKRYGKEETYECRKINYKQYLNSKTQKKKEHFEYLFFIEKKNSSEIIYKSPLNYMGGKYNLINFIKDNAPSNIYRFVDLFGGGFNVGINFDSKQIIYNDINFKVKELIEMFKNKDTLELIQYIKKMIKKYNLKKNDRESFEKIRDLYNSKPHDLRSPELLYLLILYGFNQQIRFNSNLDYNNTVGPSSFNERVLENIISYMNNLKSKNVIFYSKDYTEIIEDINYKSFVYVDPPYLITCGSYNDGKRGFNGWDEKEEIRLLKFLDRLNKKKVKFMLSNIFVKDDEVNNILQEWVLKNNFTIKEFLGKTKKGRKEVLIMNY